MIDLTWKVLLIGYLWCLIGHLLLAFRRWGYPDDTEWWDIVHKYKAAGMHVQAKRAFDRIGEVGGSEAQEKAMDNHE